MKRLALVALALVACGPPSPDEIRVASRTDPQALSADDSFALARGDLALVDAVPVDGGSQMDLCIDAISSDPGVARVLRVKGECRVFVVTGEGAGSATVRFSARGTTHAVRVDVK